MMETLRSRWAAFSERERLLLAIMATLIVAVAFWFAIVMPARAYMADAQPRLVAAEQLHARAQAAAQSQSKPLPQVSAQMPLAEVVAETADAAGFVLVRNQPAGGDQGATSVEVELGSARAPALFSWLKVLEGQGITVRTASFTPRSDATLAVILSLGRAT